MNNYDDEWGFVEETIFDEILEETRSSLKDALKTEIKDEINNIKSENKRLKKKIDELELKAAEQKERLTIFDMYRKKFSEILKPIEENLEGYSIDEKYVKNKKCDKCNDERKIEFKSTYGDSKFEKCKCDSEHMEYFPDKRTIKTIFFYKNNRNRELIATPKYDSKQYDDTYCQFEFKKYIDKFDTNIMKEENFSKWDFIRSTIFTTEEVCQKYCNYLNRGVNNGI